MQRAHVDAIALNGMMRAAVPLQGAGCSKYRQSSSSLETHLHGVCLAVNQYSNKSKALKKRRGHPSHQQQGVTARTVVT